MADRPSEPGSAAADQVADRSTSPGPGVRPGRHTPGIEELVAAEKAARVAGESAAEWWREMNASAASARTDRALDDLFRHALATIKVALDADALSVLVANEAEDELVARAATGLGEEVTMGLGIRTGEGMSGRILASRGPLVFEDLSMIDVVSPALRHSGLRSAVGVPIIYDHRVLGVLYAGSRQLDHFSDLDAELLAMMADRLAGALERVRAFERERAARLRAEAVTDRLARLQRITSRLVQATTADEVALALTEQLTLTEPGTRQGWTGVWLVRDGLLTLVRTRGSAPVARWITDIALDEDNPLAPAVLDRRATYSSLTIQVADPAPPGTPESVPVDFAAVPLVVRQEAVGVVVVAFAGSHTFDEDERAFLAAMADQAAQAIERARLYSAQVALADTNRFLARAARAIAEGADYQDTLVRLANLALPVLGDICLIDVVDEDGGVRRMVARHRDATRQPALDRLERDYPPDPQGVHPAVEVIRTGKTRWSEEMSDEFLRDTTRDDEHFALVKSLGFRSYVAVPLVGEAEVLGSLTLVSAGRPFVPDDVAFAERLAEQVAAVVNNARRYESTLATSHALQQSLLPSRLPDVAGLEVHTRYLPATRGLEVGGDFYDLVVLPSGKVDFMIGDVAGHDRDAAALMGHLRSSARALAGQVDSPAELIDTLQSSWHYLAFDRFATALIGQLDPATGDLVMASAGHYPPLLLDGRSATYLPVGSTVPLGVAGPAAVDWQGTLLPGQVLFLYTDGAVDERGVGAELSMAELAAAATGDPIPWTVCDRVVSRLPVDRGDDVALLALRRNP